MRFPRPLTRMFSLLLFTACPAIVSADGPAMPARRVQIQCVALRARISDVDSFGFNFDLIMPKSYLPSGLLSSPPEAISYAHIAHGKRVAEMLKSLETITGKTRGSAFAAPTVTIADGENGVISLANLIDPGLTKAPWLIVIPHVNVDKTISIFVAPQFQFVSAPGIKDDPPATKTEAFPIRLTAFDKNMIVFTEESKAILDSDTHPIMGGLHSGPVLNIGTTQLWLFLTVILLPETPTPGSLTEPTHHA